MWTTLCTLMHQCVRIDCSTRRSSPPHLHLSPQARVRPDGQGGEEGVVAWAGLDGEGGGGTERCERDEA